MKSTGAQSLVTTTTTPPPSLNIGLDPSGSFPLVFHLGVAGMGGREAVKWPRSGFLPVQEAGGRGGGGAGKGSPGPAQPSPAAPRAGRGPSVLACLRQPCSAQ